MYLYGDGCVIYSYFKKHFNVAEIGEKVKISSGDKIWLLLDLWNR